MQKSKAVQRRRTPEIQRANVAAGFQSCRKKHGRIRVLPPHAELDAALFHLYAINRDDAEYILSTFKDIHVPKPVFPGHFSTAEYILQ